MDAEPFIPTGPLPSFFCFAEDGDQDLRAPHASRDDELSAAVASTDQESPSPRDAATSARDGRAPQS